MKLCDIKAPKSATKGKKRIGRGNGSGSGTTCGRGSNGQLSRSGGKTRLGFEGGQMPLQRRLPHLKGFKNTRKKIYTTVNIGSLDVFKEGTVVDYKALDEKGLLKGKGKLVKILGNGDISKKMTIKASAFSKTAVEKIEKLGGKVEVV